ncbi:MAG: FHA domain-containing protein [Planctomycetota bacterium]|nr:FHA domain-containing protein [Planctomycetota bacterium]
MLVTLKVADGPQANERVQLTPGRTVTIGRSNEADFAIASDRASSRKHFQLVCTAQECMVEDFESKSGTFLNGDRLDGSARVRSADELLAGRTRFVVEIAADTEMATMELDAGVYDESNIPPELVAELDDDGFTKLPLTDLAARAAYDDEARALMKGANSPKSVVQTMLDHKKFVEAMRAIGHGLPRRESVWWAAQCVRRLISKLSEQDQKTLVAAETWCAEPSEDHRRAAEAAAIEAKHETPAAWVAMGAFWSCGSMGPPDVPVVPPGPELIGTATSSAVLLAVVAEEPEKAESKYETCSKTAFDVASTANRWEV